MASIVDRIDTYLNEGMFNGWYKEVDEEFVSELSGFTNRLHSLKDREDVIYFIGSVKKFILYFSREFSRIRLDSEPRIKAIKNIFQQFCDKLAIVAKQFDVPYRMLPYADQLKFKDVQWSTDRYTDDGLDSKTERTFQKFMDDADYKK